MKKLTNFTLVELLIIIGIITTFSVIGLGFYINQQKAKIFKCGDSVTFTYKGEEVIYGIVESHGKCWLDRNLGADRVAIAYNDADAYGDLFQWGRLDDGHQNRNSDTTTSLSTSNNPGHSNFIIPDPYDWRWSQNDNLWQGVSGINNPCPSGWRIPTESEWVIEQENWSQQNYNGAYASPLKLTIGGYRDYSHATIYNVGSTGFYWSSTVSDTHAFALYFPCGKLCGSRVKRANGYSVRCLKD